MGSGVIVKNVSKRFGNVQALADVSFEIPDNCFCTLLGPSGCGKSTLLRLLAGLDKPDAGEIWIQSVVMTSDRIFVSPEARRIGFVFQSYALWPHMTVFDQVAYPLRVQRFHRQGIQKQVEKTVSLVGLKHHLDRYPAELSGGQQQRVALARALVFEPGILLLDEPLSNLDAELRRQMRIELIDLRKRIAATIVYVTHDQVEAMALSDLVVVMNSGRIVEMGPPKSIYEHPTTPYTAAFVGSANLIKATVLAADDHRVSASLVDGTVIEGVTNESIRTGDAVVLAIKPEDVRIAAGNHLGNNSIRAEVGTVAYSGSHLTLLLNWKGHEFRAQADKSSTLQAGDVVTVEVAPDHVRIFPSAGD